MFRDTTQTNAPMCILTFKLMADLKYIFVAVVKLECSVECTRRDCKQNTHTLTYTKLQQKRVPQK